jgi:hypothetical protein
MIKDNSYYKLKYLKYKSKYINYKNLIGGGPNPPTRLPPLNPQKQQIQSIYKKLYDNIDQEIVIPKILLTGTDKQKENAIKLYIIILKEFNQILVNFESTFKNDLFNIGQLFDTDGTMTSFLKKKLKELFKKSYVSKFIIDGLTENSKLYKDHTELFKKIVDKICTKLHILQIVSTGKCDDETRKEIVSNFFNSRDLFEKLVLKIVDEKIEETDADKNSKMLEAFILCIIKNEDIDLETKKDIVELILSILTLYNTTYTSNKDCKSGLLRIIGTQTAECYKLRIAHKLFQKVSIFKNEITTNQENVKKLLQKEQLKEQLKLLEEQLQPLKEQLQPLEKQLTERVNKIYNLQLLKKQKESLENEISLLEEKIKELNQLKEKLQLLNEQLQPLKEKLQPLNENQQLQELEELQKKIYLLKQEIDLLKQQIEIINKKLSPNTLPSQKLKEQEEKIKPLINILPSNTLALEIKRLKEQQEKDAKRRQQQEAEPRQQEEFILRQQEEFILRQQEKNDKLLEQARELFRGEGEGEEDDDD